MSYERLEFHRQFLYKVAGQARKVAIVSLLNQPRIPIFFASTGATLDVAAQAIEK
jgi:hypothetical protein